MIYLNYKACQGLASCLKVRPKADHDALFVTKFKTPMSGRAIQNAVTKYLKVEKLFYNTAGRSSYISAKHNENCGGEWIGWQTDEHERKSHFA
jgi:hypothetical protein